jgi:hypothetical protein
MTEKLHYHSPSMQHIGSSAIVKGTVIGLIGGLVGTIVMDLVLVATLLAVGLPAVASFATIGDAAAGFFALFGIQVAGDIPLGMAVHYLLGLILGAIFGAALFRIGALRVRSMKKGVLLAVLYIEIVSQPILAIASLILNMTAAETLQWFGVSFVMHLIWGIVLGVVVSYGLLSTASAGISPSGSVSGSL